MQIIEQTDFGIRCAEIKVTRQGGGPTFLLYPMLHVAAPKFYVEVQKRLLACDVLVLEGVGGRRVGVITLAYRIAGAIRRSGLILQSKGMSLAEYKGRIVRPDLSAKEFGSAWRRLSVKLRVILYLLTPLVGLWIAIVGPRRALGTELGLDDLPSPEEEKYSSDELDQLFLGSRDAGLIKALFGLIDEDPSSPQTIGVCWGAAHMREVVRALATRGFIPRSGEWIMAIPPRWKLTGS